MATIILVMATASDFGLRLHLHPGNSGARIKRVSFLIGNHQPIGAAQTKRVSVLDGDHQVPGSRRSNGSEDEDLIHENNYKGIHDDEKNVCL